MPSTTNIASCVTGNLGHRIFIVNQSNHLAILNFPDPTKAKGLFPTEINVSGDTVDADRDINIAAIAWKEGNHWEVRVYFATQSQMLKELTWNSVDNHYKYGDLNEKKYEVAKQSTITAESQGTVMYVYCNLTKYKSDYNVVYQDGTGWNDHNMSQS